MVIVKGSNIQLSIIVDEADKIDEVFSKTGEGGKITTALRGHILGNRK